MKVARWITSGLRRTTLMITQTTTSTMIATITQVVATRQGPLYATAMPFVAALHWDTSLASRNCLSW